MSPFSYGSSLPGDQTEVHITSKDRTASPSPDPRVVSPEGGGDFERPNPTRQKLSEGVSHCARPAVAARSLIARPAACLLEALPAYIEAAGDIPFLSAPRPIDSHCSPLAILALR